MKLKQLLSIGLSVFTIMSVIPVHAATEPVSGTLTQEFQTPPAEAKSRTRLWLPDACVEEQALREDLQQIASLGIGGVEVIAYATMMEGIPEDHAWGTEKWDETMEIIADECEKLGLDMMVTNGPSWPIAMPSIQNADEESTLYEMTYGVQIVQGGALYQRTILDEEGNIVGEDQQVPERNKVREEGTTHLMTVAAYQLTGEKEIDYDTFLDLTEYVTINEADNSLSTLDWTAPEGTEWAVFSFWEQPAAQKTNGYYVIDHFGVAGAQTCIDYWESIMSTKDYMKNASDIFEDSLEYEVDKEWTRGFLEIFKELKGYDILSYLPAIGQAGLYQTGEGPNYTFTDTELTEQIKNDYNDVVTWCYLENHLKPMQEMAEKYGMNIRAQVAYNKPMQTASSALFGGIPETEGLGRNTIDFYRLMASAVHMTDGNIYSFESAAEFNGGYSQSYEDLANWLKRAWAGGVNRQVLHGSSYSGIVDEESEQTAVNSEIWGGNVWPGFRAFGGYITNDWNRNTSEELANNYITYFSRMNYLLQKEAKIDIAVYYDTYNDYNHSLGDGNERYPDQGVLNSNGYSYEFVSPETLMLDTAVVQNNVLNEDGPAYKAIILHNQRMISLSDLERLADLSAQGLPLVFVGETPSELKYYSEVLEGHTDAEIQTLVEQLSAQTNVLTVENYDEVPSALASLGVYADSMYDTTADVLTRHVVDETGDYYYLYNYNASTEDSANDSTVGGSVQPNLDKAALQEETVTVTLTGTGIPYEMNCWNGEITPIAEYIATADAVTLNVDLDIDEAKVIALIPTDVAEANQLEIPTEHSENLDGSLEYIDGSLVTKTTDQAQESFPVSSWNLTIQSLEPGETVYFKDSEWHEIAVGEITELKGWKDLDDSLASVAGIGVYQTSIELENGWEEGFGAWIDLGEVEDTYKIAVNGTELPMSNQISTVLDIGEYLQKGTNEITVTVATTLYNKTRETGGSLTENSMIAQFMSINFHEPYNNGLLGTNGVVTVIPYRIVENSVD